MKPPSVPNLYPELPTEDGQNYRLQKIIDIEKTLMNERDVRKTLYKKYKRAINVSEGVDTAFMASSVIIAGIGLSIPILLPLEIAAFACGTLGMCVRLTSRGLKSKAKKHYEIKTIADSKLNTIKDFISNALSDGQISDNEFKLVLDELEKYNKLKESIRSKQIGLSETDRNKLIQEGKAQAMSEMKKKIENA